MERPQSARRGCLVAVGLLVAAVGCLGYLVVDLVAGYQPVGDAPQVAVPPGGVVDLRAGEYEVHYLTDDAVAAGLCAERSDSAADGSLPHVYWYCTSGPLARAGGLTITGPDGRHLDLEEAPEGRREPEHLRVWELEVPEAGRHRIEMPDPPDGIHAIAIRYVDDGRTSPISLALFWAIPLCGLAALVVGIRALTRPARNPLPAAPGWRTDPTGRAPQRWWDGHRWTDAVMRAGQVEVDPLER